MRWPSGERSNTFNTASFGLPLPGFDPQGEVVGPVRTIDFRGRVQAPIVNLPAVGRIRSARSAARASEADATNSAEQSAQLAAAAYLRALRADEVVSARAADSVLAAELLGIAQNQLTAGVAPSAAPDSATELPEPQNTTIKL